MTALRHLRRPERPRGSAQPSPGVLRGRQHSRGSVHGRKGPESPGPGGRGGVGRGDQVPAGPGRGSAGQGARPGWVWRPGEGGSGAGRRRGGEKSKRRRRGEERRGEGARGGPGGPGRTGLAASAPLRRLPPAGPRLAAWPAPGRPVVPVGPPGAGSGWASLGRLAPPCPSGLRGPGPTSRAPRRPRPGRPLPAPPPHAGLAARAGASSLKGRPACSAPLASVLSGKGPAPRAGRELLKRHTRLPAPSTDRASRGVSPPRGLGNVQRLRGWRRAHPGALLLTSGRGGAAG